MIVTKITHGLGNQLFQYAIARHLSIRSDTALYVDLAYYRQFYESDTPREFKLHHFDVDYNILNTSPLLYVSKATKLFPNRSFGPFFKLVKEEGFAYNPQPFETRALMVTLDGFWQSERYFSGIGGLLRKELTVKKDLGPVYTAYRDQIAATPVSVSVHIRRGDYVHNTSFSQTFGFVGMEYYERAIVRIRERFPNSRFFVFTDDHPWVAEHFRIGDDAVFVQNEGADSDLADLMLMRTCRHHIIANSSFSWWGAWLNERPDKYVIAPAQWFRNKPELDTKDLIPASWVKL